MSSIRSAQWWNCIGCSTETCKNLSIRFNVVREDDRTHLETMIARLQHIRLCTLRDRVEPLCIQNDWFLVFRFENRRQARVHQNAELRDFSVENGCAALAQFRNHRRCCRRLRWSGWIRWRDCRRFILSRSFSYFVVARFWRENAKHVSVSVVFKCVFVERHKFDILLRRWSNQVDDLL